MATLREFDCVDALKIGVDAQLLTDGLTASWRVFCTDDDTGETDEDRVYPAIEVVWMPLIPIGYQQTADSTVPMIIRCVTHHADDQKGVNCAAIYESVRTAIDSYDFASDFTLLTSGIVMVAGSDSGIDGMTRYIELELNWKVCG